MFLLKILFTLAAIIGVWVVFRAASRMARGERRTTPAEEAARAARAATEARAGKSVDLVKCPSCGAYHDSGTPCACRNGRPE
ncbi:hypothetical protein IHV25_03425 [Phaeovibrio sulfidiphilus]|uniref:Uncharacterized protein n=1 Tax=Phaeovibrio sulfidiphilus TaxID=1220600 RepID=A0A8J6YLD1_9PROT|nr:hypothetical protein [Phaeovibrio sulfidiphilus]MBE1236703.1 hypothetical protein [Phaeovibrio sulfidiphilus]